MSTILFALATAPETERDIRVSGGRLLVARILVVLATSLAVVGALAGYLRWQALDQDTFADTTEELIANDSVRDQIGDSVVEELFANVDVPAELEQRLPEDQRALAGPIAGGLREFADRTVQRLLDSSRGQELLEDSLVTAHDQLLAVLDDESTDLVDISSETDETRRRLDQGATS